MSVIALLGLKGGIGKSSIAAHLAVELATRRRVVAFDLDPQRSLVAWAASGPGVLAGLVRPVDATHPARFRAEVDAANREAERVVLDTPPGFQDAALLAALVADVVLLPAGPSPLDLLALEQALEVARRARAERGGPLPRIGLVPNRVQTATTIGKDLPATLRGYGERVLPALRHRVAFAEAALVGQTVGEYRPGSPAHQDIQALTRAVEALLR
jgi:chromosome partitioning protein